jgi:beta-galactosidase
MKDEFNALRPERQPGTALSKLLGGDVVEFYALDKNVLASGKLGTGEATIWAERLEANDPSTEVLLRYGKSNGWLDGEPAVITRRVGAGSITYVGAQFDPALMTAITSWMIANAGLKPTLANVPEGVEVCQRVGPGKRVLILINHTTQSQTIALPRAMRELLKGQTTSRNVVLPAGDVAVFSD